MLGMIVVGAVALGGVFFLIYWMMGSNKDE
jgi:hypothetical protein